MDSTQPIASVPKKGPIRRGRRKIKIEYIKDKSRRHITFSKRKAGIMKKAYELATLTGTQVLLLVASETGHVYTFATPKLQPLITEAEGKNLIQACLNAPDSDTAPPQEVSSPTKASAAGQGLNIHHYLHKRETFEDDDDDDEEDEKEYARRPKLEPKSTMHPDLPSVPSGYGPPGLLGLGPGSLPPYANLPPHMFPRQMGHAYGAPVPNPFPYGYQPTSQYLPPRVFPGTMPPNMSIPEPMHPAESDPHLHHDPAEQN